MEEVLTVTEAVRNFSDIINRVYYKDQSYLLTRGGVVVAKLIRVGKILTGAELARRWPAELLLDPEEAARWELELAELKAAIGPPEEDTGEWDS